MFGWRVGLLLFIALGILGIGIILLFEPAPDEPLEEFALRTNAVMASSASTGLGVLLPRMAIAADSLEPQPGAPPIMVAVARRTRTPTPTPPPPPTLEPTIEPTLEPTLEPTAAPTQPSATPIAVTNTPAPTTEPGPTQTLAPPTEPRPTREPGLAGAITSCGAITNPGKYHLAGSLAANSDCINIRSSDVVLDCQGNAITGAGFSGVGIVIRKLGILGGERPRNIEIRNCSVSGFRYGIYVEGGSNVFIHDNNVSRNYDDVDGRRYGIFLGMVEGGGIRLNETDNSRIENNLTQNQAIGIDVRTSNDIQVRGNTTSDNSAWGINLVKTTNSEISGNTAERNVRYCTWGEGVVGPGCDAGGIILQDGSSGNRILNNTVGSGNGNGIFIKAHGVPCGNNNVIASNQIHQVMYNGIELGFCTGNQIIGNNLSHSIDGIWMGFATGNVIKDNTISNMNNHGIIVLNSFDNEVSGNTVINAREGIYFFWEQKNQNDFWWLDVNQFRSYRNRIIGNTLRDNNKAGIVISDSTDNVITNNVFSNNAKNIQLHGNTNGNEIRDNQE